METLQNDGIGNVIKSQIKSLPCFTDRAAIRLRHEVKNGLTLSGVGPLKDPSIHRQTLQAAAAAGRVGGARSRRPGVAARRTGNIRKTVKAVIRAALKAGF